MGNFGSKRVCAHDEETEETRSFVDDEQSSENRSERESGTGSEKSSETGSESSYTGEPSSSDGRRQRSDSVGGREYSSGSSSEADSEEDGESESGGDDGGGQQQRDDGQGNSPPVSDLEEQAERSDSGGRNSKSEVTSASDDPVSPKPGVPAEASGVSKMSERMLDVEVTRTPETYQEKVSNRESPERNHEEVRDDTASAQISAVEKSTAENEMVHTSVEETKKAIRKAQERLASLKASLEEERLNLQEGSARRMESLSHLMDQTEKANYGRQQLTSEIANRQKTLLERISSVLTIPQRLVRSASRDGQTAAVPEIDSETPATPSPGDHSADALSPLVMLSQVQPALDRVTRSLDTQKSLLLDLVDMFGSPTVERSPRHWDDAIERQKRLDALSTSPEITAALQAVLRQTGDIFKLLVELKDMVSSVKTADSSVRGSSGRQKRRLTDEAAGSGPGTDLISRYEHWSSQTSPLADGELLNKRVRVETVNFGTIKADHGGTLRSSDESFSPCTYTRSTTAGGAASGGDGGATGAMSDFVVSLPAAISEEEGCDCGDCSSCSCSSCSCRKSDANTRGGSLRLPEGTDALVQQRVAHRSAPGVSLFRVRESEVSFRRSDMLESRNLTKRSTGGPSTSTSLNLVFFRMDGAEAVCKMRAALPGCLVSHESYPSVDEAGLLDLLAPGRLTDAAVFVFPEDSFYLDVACDDPAVLSALATGKWVVGVSWLDLCAQSKLQLDMSAFGKRWSTPNPLLKISTFSLHPTYVENSPKASPRFVTEVLRAAGADVESEKHAVSPGRPLRWKVVSANMLDATLSGEETAAISRLLRTNNRYPTRHSSNAVEASRTEVLDTAALEERSKRGKLYTDWRLLVAILQRDWFFVEKRLKSPILSAAM